ncbi:MAG: hypothetical protein LBT05_10975 [Planctomycetaceae bacterium]|jgi:hypothetical protein|nr:hypothetical protein [Planctomycetaceae bacterium]
MKNDCCIRADVALVGRGPLFLFKPDELGLVCSEGNNPRIYDVFFTHIGEIESAALHAVIHSAVWEMKQKASRNFIPIVTKYAITVAATLRQDEVFDGARIVKKTDAGQIPLVYSSLIGNDCQAIRGADKRAIGGAMYDPMVFYKNGFHTYIIKLNPVLTSSLKNNERNSAVMNSKIVSAPAFDTIEKHMDYLLSVLNRTSGALRPMYSTTTTEKREDSASAELLTKETTEGAPKKKVGRPRADADEADRCAEICERWNDYRKGKKKPTYKGYREYERSNDPDFILNKDDICRAINSQKRRIGREGAKK